MADYLTVSQAAARLGLSERTIRKRIKAGEIEAEKQPLDGGGLAWHVHLSPERAGSEPEAERKTEPEARRKPIESESVSQRNRAGSATENAPEVSEPRAGSEPEAALLDQLRGENAFLRSMLEARERDAAELRAALRKALDAMPKALASGSTPDEEKTTRENDLQAPQTASGDQTGATVKGSAQRGAQRRELSAWQRIAARVLGIR